MGHDWRPEEWRDMDAWAIHKCLSDYDRRICVEGQEWIRLVPDAVISEAVCLIDRNNCDNGLVYEVARRIDELHDEVARLQSELADLAARDVTVEPLTSAQIRDALAGKG